MSFVLDQITNSVVRPDFERVLGLLLQPGVTDVLANGADEWWIDAGAGLKQLDDFRVSQNDFDYLARLWIALGERHLDLLAPMADASIGANQLPVLASSHVSRIRAHATLASEVSDQTLLSFRVHRRQAFTLQELSTSGMLINSQLGQLRDLLDNGANFLISGSAGSGKTTLLRAMLAETPNPRTVVVEDSTEILPVSGHVLGLQARPDNVEGEGRIELADLARQALRMRPDRLVIGEVRGAEAITLLQAMNTGHAGSAATIHANSVPAVRARFAGLLAPFGLGRAAVEELFDSAIDAVIQLRPGRPRGISQIWVRNAHEQAA